MKRNKKSKISPKVNDAPKNKATAGSMSSRPAVDSSQLSHDEVLGQVTQAANRICSLMRRGIKEDLRDPDDL